MVHGWFIRSLEEHKVPMFDLFKSPQQTEQQGVHATGTFLPQCLGRSLDKRASESHSVTEGDFPHFPACVSLCVHSGGTSNQLVMHAAHPFAREKKNLIWMNKWHRNKRRLTPQPAALIVSSVFVVECSDNRGQLKKTHARTCTSAGRPGFLIKMTMSCRDR